jgi:hypothetical protein
MKMCKKFFKICLGWIPLIVVVACCTVILGCGAVLLLSACMCARNLLDHLGGCWQAVRARVSWGRPRLFASEEAKVAYKRTRVRKLIGGRPDRAARARTLAAMKNRVSHF